MRRPLAQRCRAGVDADDQARRTAAVPRADQVLAAPEARGAMRARDRLLQLTREGLFPQGIGERRRQLQALLMSYGLGELVVRDRADAQHAGIALALAGDGAVAQ